LDSSKIEGRSARVVVHPAGPNDAKRMQFKRVEASVLQMLLLSGYVLCMIGIRDSERNDCLRKAAPGETAAGT
jgi:hypothetical protein